MRRCIHLVDIYATQGWRFIGTATNDVAPIMNVNMRSPKQETNGMSDSRGARLHCPRRSWPWQVSTTKPTWQEFPPRSGRDQRLGNHQAAPRASAPRDVSARGRLEGIDPPGAERAARLLIRMAAAEQNASFLSACVYSNGLYYNRDVIWSYAIRNIFTSFLFWAPRVAAHAKAGASSIDFAAHEEK